MTSRAHLVSPLRIVFMWRVVVSCTDCVTVHVAVTNLVLMQGSLSFPFLGDQAMQIYFSKEEILQHLECIKLFK